MENEQLKENIINSVSQILNQCKVFTKVFGKGFAKRQLKQNIETVEIIRNRKIGTSGNYNDEKNQIVLTYLTSRKINSIKMDQDEMLKRIRIHEGIHAVLKKSKNECKRYGIIRGNGTMFVLPDGSEYGRGLDEGLSNWLAEKAGIPMKNYSRLKKVVKILEMAVGEKNIMKMAKGNPRKSIPKTLGISQEESMGFLKNLDKIWLLEKEVDYIEDVMQILEKYKSREQFDPAEQEEIKAMYQTIIQDKRYHIILSEAQKTVDKTETVEEKIQFFMEKRQEKEEELKQDTEDFLEFAFEQYFDEKVDEILEKKRISYSEIKQMKRLRKLIYQTLSIGKKAEDEEILAGDRVADFIEISYPQLYKRYKEKDWKKENTDALLLTVGLEDRKEGFRKDVSDMSKYKGEENLWEDSAQKELDSEQREDEKEK